LIQKTEQALQSEDYDAKVIDQQADTIAADFLRLEKYVNINFMGFHKILKKHDKNLPAMPCKAFYVNRLHAQAWVRGDYSDVVVRLSNIYAALRQDRVAEENKDAAQSFLRSTTKYWVKTEDVSRVKYAVLRHLPVFLQKTSTGESDSQFTNSVYLDNDQLELYHGRLDKTPGAIALRLRWYGPEDPKIVFVERKTHNDSWTGEVSVKERFMVSSMRLFSLDLNDYFSLFLTLLTFLRSGV
jgi:SPX domain protein involved in polyphosphate accumulation